MFGWRKRDQDFEWRTYVRTTILLRRQRRKEKLDDARQAAVRGLGEAGRKGIEAGSSGLALAGTWLKHGAARADAGLRSGLRRARSELGSGLGSATGASARLFRSAGHRLAPAGEALARVLQPGRDVLAAPGIALSLVLVALICTLAGGYRVVSHGVDSEAMVPLGVAVACALLLLLGRAEDAARLVAPVASRMPRIPAPVVRAGIAGLALLAGGSWWMTRNPATQTAVTRDKASAVPVAAGAKSVAGRAIVRSGDTLRVGGVSIRLAGIEALHPEQTCTRAGQGRRWKCGETSLQALREFVRGKIVTCDMASREDAGRAVGSCRADRVDIAGELVKRGQAFAEPGIFSRYGALEGEARAAKVGIWNGDAERPAEFRAKRWEEAKRSSPEGCPIKALVSSEGRVYVLPWSRAYERVKVRGAKGDRWFCSEAEAQAAGWRPTDKS